MSTSVTTPTESTTIVKPEDFNGILAQLHGAAQAVEDLGARIDRLEDKLLERPQIEIVPRHFFAEGLYAREICIPRGALVTGKKHRTRHVNVVSKGRILVYTEREGMKLIEAPCTFVAEPGTRRVGYALEETVWTTFHGTEETDLEKLESELIEPRAKPLEINGGPLCPG